MEPDPLTPLRIGSSEVLAIVQARMSSERLPGKVLRRLAGRTVLDHVVTRARSIAAHVVVCTSVDPADDPIVNHCAELSVPCHRGSLHDVFSRFRSVLHDSTVPLLPWFARITGDCPLLSQTLATWTYERMPRYADHGVIDPEKIPRGLSLEVVRRNAFLGIRSSELDSQDREHVTLFLYEHPERFNCRRLNPPPSFAHPELRLTLDYPEDLELLELIFDEDPNLSAESAIERLLAEPELQTINMHCEQKRAR